MILGVSMLDHNPTAHPHYAISRYDLVIVDGSLLVAEAIQCALHLSRRFNVTIASDLKELLAIGGKPDVIMLDIQLPGIVGAQSVSSVLNRYKASNVVLFSASADTSFIKSAINMGAKGFISKSMPLSSLTSALELVATGQPFIPPDILLDSTKREFDAKSAGLSKVEYNVLIGIAAGKRNKEIALEFDVNETAIKMHVRSIFSKLGVQNRTSAVLAGQRLSIL